MPPAHLTRKSYNLKLGEALLELTPQRQGYRSGMQTVESRDPTVGKLLAFAELGIEPAEQVVAVVKKGVYRILRLGLKWGPQN